MGFPPNHPYMGTLLGVAISVRGEIYGDLYLSERQDGEPFDADDESVVIALAGAAGIAIENVRLFERVREGAEQFQRLLLPTLPDLRPFTAAAVYRPAAEPSQLGGDWYDAIPLPGNVVAVVIGDVVGHDLPAAAAMASTRNMLRALLFDRSSAPGTILSQLDHTLQAITENPITTTTLARIEPDEGAGGCPGAAPATSRTCCSRRAARRSTCSPIPACRWASTPGCPDRTTPVSCRPAPRWSSSPTAWSNTPTTRSTRASPN